jgi:hypothetical protein
LIYPSVLTIFVLSLFFAGTHKFIEKPTAHEYLLLLLWLLLPLLVIA